MICDSLAYDVFRESNESSNVTLRSYGPRFDSDIWKGA